MIGDPLRSAPITGLYPTQYEWLRRCPLHVALDQQRKAAGGRRRKSDAQRLGDVIHRVLKHLVDDGSLLDDVWEQRVEAAWAAEVTAEVAAAGALEPAEPAAKWADYEEKHQRTVRLAGKVRQLLLTHGPDGFLTEEHVAGRGGRLMGIADLIVRTETLHAVIDYKTGAVASDDGELIKGEYVRQLRLYASMEAEVSGSWPGEISIYPLKGPVVSLEAAPGACEQTAADALEQLDAYNAAAPGPQEARPVAASCTRCEFATTCDAFWASMPMEGVTTAAGRVTEVFLAERGSISIVVEAPDGATIEVLAIHPAFHPAAARVRAGDHVRLIGIEAKDQEGFFRLPVSGQLGINSPA